jgi:hypothetical protein
MTNLVIRYQTKPEATQQNADLIRNVFREAAAAAPEGVRYCVLQAEDGTFYHLVAYDSEAANTGLTSLPAFQAFAEDGESRRSAPFARQEVVVLGNYRMLPD